MRHQLLHRGALAAATLALAASTAATAADDFRGIWRGTWDNGDTTELTVVDVVGGHAFGTYCTQSRRNAHRHFFFDLHPEEAVAARLEDDVLRFKLGEGKHEVHWVFRVDRANPDVVRLAYRYREARELDLERADAQICAARIAQLTPPAGAATPRTVADLTPDSPGHWAVGSWIGKRPNGLIIELSVLDVLDGRARGVYCNERDGPTFAALDLEPDGLDARVTRKKLSFRIHRRGSDIQFAFKRTGDPDVLASSRRHRGKKRAVEMHRTREPTCATRIAPR